MLRIILLAKKKTDAQQATSGRIESKILNKVYKSLEWLFAASFSSLSKSCLCGRKNTKRTRPLCDWTFSCCCVNKSTLYVHLWFASIVALFAAIAHTIQHLRCDLHASAATPFPIIKFKLIFIEAMGIGGRHPAQWTNKIGEGKVNYYFFGTIGSSRSSQNQLYFVDAYISTQYMPCIVLLLTTFKLPFMRFRFLSKYLLLEIFNTQ